MRRSARVASSSSSGVLLSENQEDVPTSSLMIHHRRPVARSKRKPRDEICRIAFGIVLFTVLAFSLYGLKIVLGTMAGSSSEDDAVNPPTDDVLLLLERLQQTPPILLTTADDEGKVMVTADVRGNLGDAAKVLITPGTDWLKDRWQAASDMHGTAIQGVHWVQIDFLQPTTITDASSSSSAVVVVAAGRNATLSTPTPSPVFLNYVVLDWETAYSEDYELQGFVAAIKDGNSDGDIHYHQWITLFDSKVHSDRIVTSTSGQSPGVKDQQLPLHIIHNISLWEPSIDDYQTLQDMADASNKYRSLLLRRRRDGRTHQNDAKENKLSGLPECVTSLRIWIRSSKYGWGVSLWQVSVFGWDATSYTN